MKVKNTQRHPIDIEIAGTGGNLHLGPRGGGNDTSRELTQAEIGSPDVKRHIKSGRLVEVEAAKPEKRKAGDE